MKKKTKSRKTTNQTGFPWSVTKVLDRVVLNVPTDITSIQIFRNNQQFLITLTPTK